jgi:hypothetical protein
MNVDTMFSEIGRCRKINLTQQDELLEIKIKTAIIKKSENGKLEKEVLVKRYNVPVRKEKLVLEAVQHIKRIYHMCKN